MAFVVAAANREAPRGLEDTAVFAALRDCEYAVLVS